MAGGDDADPNRRAEVLFFDSDDERDLVHAQDDPETSEIYLPGFFQHVPLDTALKTVGLNVRLIEPDGTPLAFTPYVLKVNGVILVEDTTGADGIVRQKLDPGVQAVQLRLIDHDRTLSFDVGSLRSLNDGNGMLGAQGRLLNLSLGVTALTGATDEATELALKQVQRDAGLTESGQLDVATRQELIRRYGF